MWRCITSCRNYGTKNVSISNPAKLMEEDHMMQVMAKFKATPNMRVSNAGEGGRRAAVLIPLCMVKGELCLLYTLRTSQMRTHRGQVSFPGGMQDSSDSSLEATALRETHEELGISPDKIRIWGRGNFISSRGDTTVMPVVGTITREINPQRLKINPQEVEKAFAVRIEDLCKPDKLAYTQFKAGFSTPTFLGGEHRIWGLTGVITHAFMKCLLPSSMYNHEIKHIPKIKPMKQTLNCT